MSAPVPGRHGGDGAALAARLGVDADQILDLSASLNPLAPPVDDLVRHATTAIGRYPDESRAHAALAEVLEVDPDLLVLTNGGAEAIALVAGLHPRGQVADAEFSLYRRHLAEVTPTAPTWRSNPNNPTGRLADPNDQAAVWDEAFHVLATGRWSRGDQQSWRLGSLTKAFACPGLRIGYAVAPDPAEAAALRHARPRWSVNGLVCAVLPELLDRAEPDRWCRGIADLRGQLVATLRTAGFEPEPSDANYLVVRGAAGLRDHLAAQGVLIRDTSSFGFAGVRLAVPDGTGLERLAHALTRPRPESSPS